MWIESLLPICEQRKTLLMINGRVDVARCFLPSVGVQLPERGLAPDQARKILGGGVTIGASRHTAVDARRAVDVGADLVTLSPIFESPGHGEPLGLDVLTTAVELVGRNREADADLYALGGLSAENAKAVWATGVAGIAAIRAAWRGGFRPSAV